MASIDQQLIDDIKGKFEDAAFTAQVVVPVNDKAIELVRRNTRSGKGLGDDEFAPYAPSTAKKKGRRAPVTFRETGAAMGSLYGEADQNRGDITFGDKAEIMYFHQKGEGRNPTREIFPEKDRPTQTMQELNDYAAELLRKYLQSGS